MEEGGGHGFFVLVVVFWRRGGEGEEEDGVFFLVVRFSLGWLVGWLAGGAFSLGLLFKRGTFLVSTFSYHAGCGYTFFFFLFFSLFFLVELEGWLDYASPDRAD